MKNITFVLLVFAIGSFIFGYVATDGGSEFFISFMRHICFGAAIALISIKFWEAQQDVLIWCWFFGLGAALFLVERTEFARFVPGFFAELGVQLVLMIVSAILIAFTLFAERAPIEGDR